MSLAGFHPLIARWFSDRLGEPTPAQVRGWEAIRSGADPLLAAPTGSGKTLAAFLSSLDQLFRESLDHSLADEVQVIYVSPLKALSADIHKNLAEPRREIRKRAESLSAGPFPRSDDMFWPPRSSGARPARSSGSTGPGGEPASRSSRLAAASAAANPRLLLNPAFRRKVPCDQPSFPCPLA